MTTYYVNDGETASGTTVLAGDYMFVAPGGTAIATLIEQGGLQTDEGSATNTQVAGEQDIVSGGTATTTTVTQGGLQVVGNGSAGTATDTTLQGGEQDVHADGQAVTTSIESGGSQYIVGGMASGTTIHSGGYQEVDAGGTATGSIVNGGTEVVLSGGSITDTTVEGGSLILRAGAETSGSITFVGPGSLEVDETPAAASVTFASSLANVGAGDAIDLTGMAYSNGNTSATASGSTLTVTNGSVAETFTLQSPMAQAYTVSQDSGGGVLVTAVVSPTITGTHASSTTSGAAVSPFAGVTVADANLAATETLTIALTGALGTLADGPASSNLVVNPDGTYTLSGTATAVTEELDGLVFTPTSGIPGTTSTTSFVLTDTSSIGLSATDTSTSVSNLQPSVASPSGGATSTASQDTSTTSQATATASSASSTTTADGVVQGPDVAAASSTTVVGSAQGPDVTTPVQSPSGISLDPTVTYAGRGMFTLSGRVASTVGVTGVELSAMVDGVESDLGAATLNADGTFTFSDLVGRHLQSFITATEIDGTGPAASATADYSLQAGLRTGAVRARQDSYNDTGDEVTCTSLFRAGGSRTVTVQSSAQTFEPNFLDTFNNAGEPENTFVFNPGYGLDVINQFRVDGTDHDKLNLPSSDFTSIAQVLLNTHNVGGSAVISDPNTGDEIRLTGISKGELTRNAQDIAFHP